MKESVKRVIFNALAFVPDRAYLSALYYFRTRKKLNWNKPKTFNEKLQWLKLNDRKPEYTEMVDKYLVKKYVEKCVGKKYIIPTLGVWDNFEQINFEELPNQFVLKTTHDSGGVVICKDKTKFDETAAKIKLEKNLHQNYFWSGREWPYSSAWIFTVLPITMQISTYTITTLHNMNRFLFVTLSIISLPLFLQPYPIYINGIINNAVSI